MLPTLGCTMTQITSFRMNHGALLKGDDTQKEIKGQITGQHKIESKDSSVLDFEHSSKKLSMLVKSPEGQDDNPSFEYFFLTLKSLVVSSLNSVNVVYKSKLM